MKMTITNQMKIASKTATKIGYSLTNLGKMPNDNFLYVAIAQNKQTNEWVTWFYNANDDGFTNGYYTDSKTFAIDEYNKRRNK